MAKTLIRIGPDGSVKAMPGDAKGEKLLQDIGCPAPTRASHVEPIPDSNPWQWSVDMSPLGPNYQFCLWPPFPSREAALEAEHNWIAEYWLKAPLEIAARYVRVYPNGYFKRLSEVQMQDEYCNAGTWATYNMTFRCGCALLINGYLIYKGIGVPEAALAPHRHPKEDAHGG